MKKLSDINGFPKQVSQQSAKQVVGQVPPNNHVQTQAVPQIIDPKMVPIQITLPAQPGTNIAPRVLTIQVPAMALQGNQLNKVLTGPIITAAMSLPPPLASSILQQHVNEALSQQSQQVVRQITKPVLQTDGLDIMSDDSDSSGTSITEIRDELWRRLQVDGPMDTSDEEEDGSEEEDASEDADDEKDEDEQEVDDGGPEEEPLNSEDDVTDEDPADLFDTENVVVCQYDKVRENRPIFTYFIKKKIIINQQITRTRNKWKFHLKDGIMNLNGEDYLFQKASGDAEW